MTNKKRKKSIPKDPAQAAKRVLDFVINKTENPDKAVAETGIIITKDGGWRLPTKQEQEQIKILAKQAVGSGFILPTPEQNE